MIRKCAAILLLSFCLLTTAFAQDIVQTKQYPKNYFRYPLDLAPSTAGSFAELRPNHFHSGLDFKTNHQSGYPVYAAADGFVSRLRVQYGGFGNAVYITHPNGYTTVYGHLEKFNPQLAQLVHDYQVQQKNDLVDFNLLPLQVPVIKGQVIAISGSTGDAVGPHLHFEIRDTQTEQTINPQLFGLTIPDYIPPFLGTACVYHLGDAPFSEKTGRELLTVVGADGQYHLKKPEVVNVSGNTAFGITAVDINNTSPNNNGIYSIELKVDGKTVFTFAAERFGFDETRAINAYIDYPEFMASHRFIQKCFILPGSRVTLYPQSVNRGVVNFNDDSLHTVEYVVKDVAGNTSTLSVRVKSSTKTADPVYQPKGILFRYGQDNAYGNDNFKVHIAAGNLYDDLDFTWQELPKKPGQFSSTYSVGNRFTPLNDVFDLWIKPDTTIHGWRADKAVIVNSAGVCEGGAYDNGWVKAQPRSFGEFCVRLDTVPPYIRPLNIINGGSMAKKSAIEIKIGDKLSGIKNYYGYIDGKFVLMHWNNKNDVLTYNFDADITPGKHTFELTVTDQKNNTNTFKADFYR
jgi:murein DD-endopeptidase MepM/ murein hydrolase activator NlpD